MTRLGLDWIAFPVNQNPFLVLISKPMAGWWGRVQGDGHRSGQMARKEVKVPSFGGSQWKRSCIGAEPATRRRDGISRSESEWQSTWAVPTGCGELRPDVWVSAPGAWLGRPNTWPARGLGDRMLPGMGWPKSRREPRDPLYPLSSPPRILEPPLSFQDSRNQFSARIQGSRAIGFLLGP